MPSASLGGWSRRRLHVRFNERFALLRVLLEQRLILVDASLLLSARPVVVQRPGAEVGFDCGFTRFASVICVRVIWMSVAYSASFVALLLLSAIRPRAPAASASYAEILLVMRP